MTKTKHHIRKDKNYLLMSFVLVFLLTIGMLVSVIQIRERNNIRSEGTTGTIINCSVDNSRLEITPAEQNLLNEINKHREQYGLKPLIWSDTLTKAAAWMSYDMLTSKSLDHIDSLGRDMTRRLNDCGYKNYYSLGENVDSGTPDYKLTFEAWKHSPPHNANMLNPNFSEAGIALDSDSATNSYFWTLDLGNKIIPSPTVIIPSPTLSPAITNPSVPPTISPSISPTIQISKNPSPTTKITPTIKTSPTPTPVITYPTLRSLDPDPAFPNSIITVKGTGGQMKFWDGFIYEGSRRYKLYLDNKAVSEIICYANMCQGEIRLQGVSLGDHTVSAEGGSKLTLKIIKPITTGIPTPTITPIPTIPPDYKPNPHDMQLFISAKIIGIGYSGNHNPKHQTRHVNVGIYDMENKLVTDGNGFIIFDKMDLFRGVIHFGPVDKGTYFVKILSDHMLREIVMPTFQELDPNRLNILPQVTLLQGDINDDNLIDINDYNTALACFQDKKCDDKALIDYSDNGTADIVDYNILLHNYWESQGD